MNELRVMEILTDWNFWGNFNSSFIERGDYLDLMESFLDEGQVLVVKGIRRAGKSALTYLLVEDLIKKGLLGKKDSLFINFEDPRFSSTLSSEDILKIYEIYLQKVGPSSNHLVVLDEVQNVVGWEKVARFFVENRGVKVIVTGSSSKLLSDEYSSVLSGRHLDVEVFPLSFKEFLNFKNLKITDEVSLMKNRVEIKRLFDEYLRFGGFPAVVLKNEKEEILRGYFKDIIIKDLVKRYSIKNISKIEELAKWYVNSISTLQSYNKIRKYLKLNLDSVERYSRYLKTVKLLQFVEKFSYSQKARIISNRKVYVIDTGFFNVVSFKFSQNIGRLYENLVSIELLRRNKSIFYWKSENNYEVDFIIRENNKNVQLIQVCYDLTDPKTKERELRGLLKASDELSCDDLVVVTWDYEAKERVKDKEVSFVPLWKWLLS